MKVSFHPMMDQLTQWWIGRLLKKDPSLSGVPKVEMAVLTCTYCHTKGLAKWWGEEIAMADPPDYPSEELGAMGGVVIRREMEMAGFHKSNADAIGDLLDREVNKRVIKQMHKELDPVFDMFQRDILRPIGWNQSGRMEMLVTSEGAKEFGARDGDIFVSAIGANGLLHL